MASHSDPQIANDSILKRSITSITFSKPPSQDRQPESTTILTHSKLSKREGERYLAQALISRRRDPNISSTLNMSSTAARPRMYENHIPSFMSVFDMDSTAIQGQKMVDQCDTETGNSSSSQLPLEHSQQQQNSDHTHALLQPPRQHRESTSTHLSDSTDSSPTTTISTIDSSSLSDPSPSSSPESPITLVPLSSFAGSTFGLDSFQSLKMADSTACLPLNDDRPMTSPSPRRKNPKSLALNLAPTIESLQASVPSSPSFIKPPTLKGRKRPSLLSLNTGAANLKPLNLDPLASPGMPTMLQRRSLKHSISSPQISSTPGFGPAGGMTLGDFTRGLGPSRLGHRGINTTTIDEVADQEAPASVQMATRVPGASVGGDSFDRPPSNEDAVSPSYPNGPILMHEPSVHLYLEPKAEEAMKFDVVINVAREVKNPFEAEDEEQSRKASFSSIASDPTSAYSRRHSVMTPDTAESMMSFRTAFEVQPFSYEQEAEESSPTTPKPSIASPRRPEYIHVPWDHNTDVKDELWDLCQLIESRTKEGKRVLVHCQQGASRSATLIIAYGMYLNPDLTANEAYAQAQAKSRWVNPNMSLLFSLNDFKKIIDRKRLEKNNAVRKPQAKHRPTLSADAVDGPSTPSRIRGNSTPDAAARDAAIAKEIEAKQKQALSNFITPERNPGFDFGFTTLPKPPSAPPPPPPVADFSEPKVAFDFGFSPIPIASNVSSASAHPRYPQDDMAWETGLLSPRLTEMTHAQNPFPRSFPMELEVPESPAVFSPRAFEFPRSFFPAPQPPVRNSLALEEDPRSPPTKGEAAIIRSIDDVL
ncbi:hypothetical protein F5884DRAFT_195169 [Xylogone sp. PMI_703]|nr:hypothetical protein F5884DRAFT_195169 [Xylogone sp. PMI_703]